jgi:lipoprotein-releasing system ATP-binding protein
MPDKDIILKGSNLTKSFPSKTGSDRLTVLNDVSISITRGDVVCVVGASGSGKSTLLHILGGLDQPDSGTISWNGQHMYDMNKDELANFRNQKLGFVFQFHHLLPEFTALENIMMPALIHEASFKTAEDRAMTLLNRFGISERADHRPTELSGGEQQRVAMARALINEPDLILADEPTGNLDEDNTEILLDMLFELREIDNVSILLITHEKDIARRTDQTFELSKAKLHSF